MKSQADQDQTSELRKLVRELELDAVSPEMPLREPETHQKMKAVFFRRWVPAALVAEALAFTASFALGAWGRFFAVSLIILFGLAVVWPRR